MPITLFPNEQVRLTSTLVDFNPDTGVEVPVDPNNVTGKIYTYNAGSGTYVQTSTFTPVESYPGSFYYDWTPTAVGKYRIDFIAIVNIDVTITDTRVFFVGDINTTTTIGLNSSANTWMFLSALEPLYVNPDEITSYYYKEGDPVEIALLIHRYSKQVEALLGEDPLTEVTPMIHDYILAATMCDLSRIYYSDGGLGGFTAGQSDTFRLGDLQVTKETSSGSGSNSEFYAAKYGNAQTWCELAAWLKDELSFRSVSMRTFVKSSAWESPVRNRVNENKFIRRRG